MLISIVCCQLRVIPLYIVLICFFNNKFKNSFLYSCLRLELVLQEVLIRILIENFSTPLKIVQTSSNFLNLNKCFRIQKIFNFSNFIKVKVSVKCIKSIFSQGCNVTISNLRNTFSYNVLLQY